MSYVGMTREKRNFNRIKKLVGEKKKSTTKNKERDCVKKISRKDKGSGIKESSSLARNLIH